MGCSASCKAASSAKQPPQPAAPPHSPKQEATMTSTPSQAPAQPANPPKEGGGGGAKIVKPSNVSNQNFTRPSSLFPRLTADINVSPEVEETNSSDTFATVVIVGNGAMNVTKEGFDTPLMSQNNKTMQNNSGASPLHMCSPKPSANSPQPRNLLFNKSTLIPSPSSLKSRQSLTKTPPQMSPRTDKNSHCSYPDNVESELLKKVHFVEARRATSHEGMQKPQEVVSWEPTQTQSQYDPQEHRVVEYLNQPHSQQGRLEEMEQLHNVARRTMQELHARLQMSDLHILGEESVQQGIEKITEENEDTDTEVKQKVEMDCHASCQSLSPSRSLTSSSQVRQEENNVNEAFLMEDHEIEGEDDEEEDNENQEAEEEDEEEENENEEVDNDEQEGEDDQHEEVNQSHLMLDDDSSSEEKFYV